MTKYLDKTTLIVATILVAVGILGGIAFKKPTIVYVNDNQENSSLGATGSGFVIETEWMQRDPLNISSALATTTTTAVATTSPVFLLENASTTVDIVTAGVSDLRLNLNVYSTTTLPFITIQQSVVGTVTDADDLGKVDYYTESSVTSGSVSVTPNTSWQIATTSTSDVSTASILLTNINSPKTRFIIGMTDAVTGTTEGMEFNLEFLKIVPN